MSGGGSAAGAWDGVSHVQVDHKLTTSQKPGGLLCLFFTLPPRSSFHPPHCCGHER